MQWMTHCVALVLTCAQMMADDGPVKYFDDVDQSHIPPRAFTVRVSSVTAEGIADKAGLKNGDSIAGVNGVRTRCRSDIVLLRRKAAETTAEVTLQVIRNGEWREVTLPNRDSLDTWGSFRRENRSSEIAKKLIAWGVRIETLPSYDVDLQSGEPLVPPIRELLPKNPGIISRFLGIADDPGPDQFEAALAELPPGAQPWFAQEKSSHRTQEALLALAQNGDEDDRAWVEGLVTTLCALLMEDFDHAEESAQPLLERKTEPFLDEVAKFYAAVARERANFTEPDDWRKCGVDEDFFAICYPYPTVPQPVATNLFAWLPELNEAYANRDKDDAADRSRAQQILRLGSSKPAAPQYQMQVAAALVCHSNHGGWPYRSALLWRQPDDVQNGLKQIWEDSPEQRNLTAFSLLAPSIITGDETALRMALRQIYTQGSPEIAVAGRIINRMIDNVPGQMDMIRRVLNDEEQRAIPHPMIYDYLATSSAILTAHLRQRTFLSTNVDLDALRDLANICQLTPWFIAESLRRNDPVLTVGRMTAPPDSFARVAKKEAATMLQHYAENFFWVADMNDFKRFDTLARQAPQDTVHTAMLAAMNGHDEFFSIDGFINTWRKSTSTTVWMEWLTNFDNTSFKTAMDAAERVRNGARPETTLNNASLNAATPAALLVFARAAVSAGQVELANKFHGMAEHFHRIGLTLYKQPVTSLWGARAFLAEAQRLLNHIQGDQQPIRPGRYEPNTLIWSGEILSVESYIDKLSAEITSSITGNYGPQPPPLIPW